MSKRLQPLDFESSPYERPTARWVCGNVALGQACRLGPSARGRCPTRFACDPMRSGESWLCTRAAAAGGPCAKGPDDTGRCCSPVPPCVPTRGLRARRGKLAFWSAVMTLAAIALAFGLDGGRMILDPGPVVQGHAEVEDCKNCHVAFDGQQGHWTLAAFAPADPAADNRKCVECHDKGGHAQRPHSLPAADLKAMSEALAARKSRAAVPVSLAMSTKVFGRAGESEEALACATCHKEHKGADHDTTWVSNQRCQSCHGIKFDSLAEGHPAYDGYPYQRRTRLAFDHQKHFRKNFTDAKVKAVPESCATCHLPDASGRFMLVQTFEQTCATCHSKDIEGESVSGPKGIAVLTIPGLDVETLMVRGHKIGRWPELAQADEVTPFMKLLLAGDPQGAGDLARIAKLDLADLSGAGDADLAAVRRLAWSVKELLFDLSVSSADTMQVRLGGKLEMRLDRVDMGRLLGHVPLDVVQAARRQWFPGLKREVLRHREERRAFLAPPLRNGGIGLWRRAAWRVAGVQVAFTSEDTARAVVGFLRRGEDGPGSAAHLQLAQAAADLLSDSEGLLDAESLRLKEYETLLKEESEADNSLFKTAPARATARPATPPAASTTAAKPAAPAEPEVPAEQAVEAPLADEAPAEAAAEPQVEVAQDEAIDPNLNPEVWAKLGGWYRRDETLYYRPTGHRDPFMRTWLDLAAESHGTPAEAFGARILTLFGDKNTPGKCTKCHSLDRQVDQRLQVNWQPFLPNPREQTFTVFNHAAHFSMVAKDGCITCHEIDPDARFAEGFRDFDAMGFAANFKPMDRMICATCHVEDAAGDACVTCHRYHVGEFPIRPVRTLITEVPLDGGKAKAEAAARLAQGLAAVATPAPQEIAPDAKAPDSAAPATLVDSLTEKSAALASDARDVQDPAPKLAPKVVRAPSETDPAAAPSVATADPKAIAIQFSAFRSLEAAAEESLRLRSSYGELLGKMEVFVNRIELSDRGTFYRVRARPFSDVEMARRVCAQLKDRSQDCLVVRDGKATDR